MIGGRAFEPGPDTIFTREEVVVFTLEADEDMTVNIPGRTTFIMVAGSTNRTFTLGNGTNHFAFVAKDNGDNSAGPFVFSIVRDATPPGLTITFPFHGFTTDQSQIMLNGIVWNGIRVIVDGCRVELHTDGVFEAPILLDIGINRISVVAEDEANNTSVLVIEVTRTRLDSDGQGSEFGMLPSMLTGAVFGIILALVVSLAMDHRERR